MQSHEERADEMLRVMGGSMSLPVQRATLRRLILAEDAVIEDKSLVRRLNEHLEMVQAQLLETRAGLEAIAYDTVVPGWIREIAHTALVSSDPKD